ncbi:MAG: hypothetical protein H7178_12960 [Chitinophagaceae bacterium]|nr:hypothetical protein [Chitinophagaceae bacterium]
MKQILATLATLISCNAFAQLKVIINGKDTLLMIVPSTIMLANKPDSSTYKMPNSLSGFIDNQQPKRNNQQGFDIYQSQVDNMPVLKPDAANLATLSRENNGIKTFVITVNPNWVKPNNQQLLRLKKMELNKLPLPLQ